MIREWRHLKMLKRSGYAHLKDEVETQNPRMRLRHRTIHVPCSALLVPTRELIFLPIGKTHQRKKGIHLSYYHFYQRVDFHHTA